MIYICVCVCECSLKSSIEIIHSQTLDLQIVMLINQKVLGSSDVQMCVCVCVCKPTFYSHTHTHTQKEGRRNKLNLFN